MEDYDLYCHYVAGLVGIGLSQLFGEQDDLGTRQQLQSCMHFSLCAAAQIAWLVLDSVQAAGMVHATNLGSAVHYICLLHTLVPYGSITRQCSVPKLCIGIGSVTCYDLLHDAVLLLLPATSGLESASYACADTLANHMGLFLQKTNIIRDYLVSSSMDGCLFL